MNAVKPNVNVDIEVEPNFVDVLDRAAELSNLELDARLEEAAIQNETSEMALCA